MDRAGAANVLLDSALAAHVQPQLRASKLLTQQLRQKVGSPAAAASLLSTRQQLYDDFFYPTFDGANATVAEGFIKLQVSVVDPVLRERLHQVGLRFRDVPNSASQPIFEADAGVKLDLQVTINANDSTHNVMCEVVKAASLIESQAAALSVPGSSRAVAAAAGSARELAVMQEHAMPLAQACALRFHGLRDFIHCDSSRMVSTSRSVQDALSAGQRSLHMTLLLKRHVSGVTRLQPSALIVDSCVSAPLLHTLAVHRQRTRSETPGTSLRHASAEWPLRVRLHRARNLIPALLHAKVPTRNTAALPKAGKHAKAPEASAADRGRALSFGMLDRPFRMSTTSRSDSTASQAAGSKHTSSASIAIASRRTSLAKASGGGIAREASQLSTHSDGEGGLITPDMQAGRVQIPGSKASAQLTSVFVRLEVVYGGEVLAGCTAESRHRQWAPHVEWSSGTAPRRAGDSAADVGSSWLTPERLLRDIPQEAQLRFTVMGVADTLPEAVTLGVAAMPLVDHRGVVVSGRHTISCWPGKTDIRSARVGLYTPPTDAFLTAHSLAEEQEEAQRNTLGGTDITPGLHQLSLEAPPDSSSGSRQAWDALVTPPSAAQDALPTALALQTSVALGLSTTVATQHDTSDLSSDLVQRARRSLISTMAAQSRDSMSAFSDDGSDNDSDSGRPPMPRLTESSAPRPSVAAAGDVSFSSGGASSASGAASPVAFVDGAEAGRAAAASAITALGGSTRQVSTPASVRSQRALKRRTGSVYYTGEDWGQQLSSALAVAAANGADGGGASSKPGSAQASGKRRSVLGVISNGSSERGSGSGSSSGSTSPPQQQSSTPPPQAVARTARLSRAARADSGFEFVNGLAMGTIGEDGDDDSDTSRSGGVSFSPSPPCTPFEDKRTAADIALMEAPAFLIPTLPASDISELYETLPLTLEIEIEGFHLPVVADAPPARVDTATVARRAQALGMAAVADCKTAHRAVLKMGDSRSHSVLRPRPTAPARPPAPPSQLSKPRAPGQMPSVSEGGATDSENVSTDDMRATDPAPDAGDAAAEDTSLVSVPGEGEVDSIPPATEHQDSEAAADTEWLECCNPYAAYARLRFALLCLGVDCAAWGGAAHDRPAGDSLLSVLGRSAGVHVSAWMQHTFKSPLHFGRVVRERLAAVLRPGPQRDALALALRSGHLPLSAALSLMLAPAHLQRHLVTDEALVYTQPHVPLHIVPRAGAVRWGAGIAMQDARYRGFYDTVPFGMQADAVSSSGDMQAAFTAAIQGSRGDSGGGATPRALALPGSVDPSLDRAAGLEGRTGLNFDAEFHIAVDKRGWMRKLGKQSWSRWRRRWFVLTERGGSLRYYESNTAGQPPKGVVALQGMTARAEPAKDRSYQRIVGSTRKNLALYCFRLGPSGEGDVESDRTYFLYTEAKRAMEEWIDAINTVASRLGSGEAAMGGQASPGVGEPLSPLTLSVSPRHSRDAAGATQAKPAGVPLAGSGSPTSNGGGSGNRTPPPKKSTWRSIKRIFGKEKADSEAPEASAAVPVEPVSASAGSRGAASGTKQRRGKRPSMLLQGALPTAGLTSKPASMTASVSGTDPPTPSGAADTASAPPLPAAGDGPRRRSASNATRPSKRGSVWAAGAADGGAAPISILPVPTRPSVVQLLQAAGTCDAIVHPSTGAARLTEDGSTQAKRTSSSGSRMTLGMFRSRSTSASHGSVTCVRGIAGAECAVFGDQAAAAHGLRGGEFDEGLPSGDAPGFWEKASTVYSGVPSCMGGEVLAWWSVLEELCNGEGSRVALPLGVMGEAVAAANLHVPRNLKAQAREDVPAVPSPAHDPPAPVRSVAHLLAQRAGSHLGDGDGPITRSEAQSSSISTLITTSQQEARKVARETALVLLRAPAATPPPSPRGGVVSQLLQAYPLLGALLPGSTGPWWQLPRDAIEGSAPHQDGSASDDGDDEGGAWLHLQLMGGVWAAPPTTALSAVELVMGDAGASAAFLQRLACAHAAAAASGQAPVHLPQLQALAGGLQVLALWAACKQAVLEFTRVAFAARVAGGSDGAASRAARVRRASADAPDVQSAAGPALGPDIVEGLSAWHDTARGVVATARDWGVQLPPSAGAEARALFSSGRTTGRGARDISLSPATGADSSAAPASGSDDSAQQDDVLDAIANTARRLLLLLQPLRAVLHGAVCIALLQDTAVTGSHGTTAGGDGAAVGTGTSDLPWLPLRESAVSSFTSAYLHVLASSSAACEPSALLQSVCVMRRASGLQPATVSMGDYTENTHSLEAGTGALHEATDAGRMAVLSARSRLQRMLERVLPPACATDARVWSLMLPAQPHAGDDTPAQRRWREMKVCGVYRPRNEARERLAEGRRRSHTGVHSDWRSLQPAANSDSVPDAMPTLSPMHEGTAADDCGAGRPTHVEVEQHTVRVGQGFHAASSLALRSVAGEYLAACWVQLNCSDDVTVEWATSRVQQLMSAGGDIGATVAEDAILAAEGKAKATSRRGTTVADEHAMMECLLAAYCSASERRASTASRGGMPSVGGSDSVIPPLPNVATTAAWSRTAVLGRAVFRSMVSCEALRLKGLVVLPPSAPAELLRPAAVGGLLLPRGGVFGTPLAAARAAGSGPTLPDLTAAMAALPSDTAAATSGVALGPQTAPPLDILVGHSAAAGQYEVPTSCVPLLGGSDSLQYVLDDVADSAGRTVAQSRALGRHVLQLTKGLSLAQHSLKRPAVEALLAFASPDAVQSVDDITVSSWWAGGPLQRHAALAMAAARLKQSRPLVALYQLCSALHEASPTGGIAAHVPECMSALALRSDWGAPPSAPTVPAPANVIPGDAAGTMSGVLLDAVARVCDKEAPQHGCGVIMVDADHHITSLGASPDLSDFQITPLVQAALCSRSERDMAASPSHSTSNGTNTPRRSPAPARDSATRSPSHSPPAPPSPTVAPLAPLSALSAGGDVSLDLPHGIQASQLQQQAEQPWQRRQHMHAWLPGSAYRARFASGLTFGDAPDSDEEDAPPPGTQGSVQSLLQAAADKLEAQLSTSDRAVRLSRVERRSLADSFKAGSSGSMAASSRTLALGGGSPFVSAATSRTSSHVARVSSAPVRAGGGDVTVSKPRLRNTPSGSAATSPQVGPSFSPAPAAAVDGSLSVGGAMLPNIFEQLFASDPLRKMTTMERAAVWQHRSAITHLPEALPKLVSAIAWVSRTQAREAHRLLYAWKPFPTAVAARYLELLDERHADQQVRAKAVAGLQALSDEEVAEMVPQLVQALKFEPHLSSPLFLWLLQRALCSPLAVGMPLYWNMEVEAGGNPVTYSTMATLMRAFTSQLPPPSRALLSTQQALWGREGAFARICEHVMMHRKQGKEKLQHIARSALRSLAEQLPSQHVLPLDGRMEVGRLLVDKCKVMDSAKKPLWLVFENADPAIAGTDHPDSKVIVMFKAGDDIRQDTVVLQLIRCMDRLWKAAGLDLCMSPYRCAPTWNDGGMLEIVTNSDTTANIQTRYGGTLGAFSDSVFKQWIEEHNGPEGSAGYDEAVTKFIRSAAGYCVATYVLGIGDRHNDNIMIKKSGHYFHIDFGHFLGNFKYQFGLARELTGFVFTPEMLHVMGGREGAGYARFLELGGQAFNIVRKHAAELINLLSLMLPCRMPELRTRDDILYLKERLALHLGDAAAADLFKNEAEAAQSDTRKRIDNTIHILVHR